MGPPVGLNGSLEEFSSRTSCRSWPSARSPASCRWTRRPGSERSSSGRPRRRGFRRRRAVPGDEPLVLARGPEARGLRRRIVASLARLARCRQGEFRFQVCRRAAGSGSGAGTWPARRSPRASTSSSSSSRSLPAGRGRAGLVRASDPALEVDRRSGGRLSVLLVDDEDLVRRLLARYLVEGGYRVVEAGDVESAVERGASLGEAGVRFVLVADLNMPPRPGTRSAAASRS